MGLELSDISDASFGERREIFIRQFGADMHEIATRLAEHEMLDEIHLMLRTLIKDRTKP